MNTLIQRAWKVADRASTVYTFWLPLILVNAALILVTLSIGGGVFRSVNWLAIMLFIQVGLLSSSLARAFQIIRNAERELARQKALTHSTRPMSTETRAEFLRAARETRERGRHNLKRPPAFHATDWESETNRTAKHTPPRGLDVWKLRGMVKWEDDDPNTRDMDYGGY